MIKFVQNILFPSEISSNISHNFREGAVKPQTRTKDEPHAKESLLSDKYLHTLNLPMSHYRALYPQGNIITR